jgi:hypothetical protein
MSLRKQNPTGNRDRKGDANCRSSWFLLRVVRVKIVILVNERVGNWLWRRLLTSLDCPKKNQGTATVRETQQALPEATVTAIPDGRASLFGTPTVPNITEFFRNSLYETTSIFALIDVLDEKKFLLKISRFGRTSHETTKCVESKSKQKKIMP